LDNIIKKPLKLAKAKPLVKYAKEIGLITSIYLIIGMPGESEDDFDRLLQFVRKNRKFINMVNPSLLFCAFYPGSSGYLNPDRYDIENLKLGPLFWNTKDGGNTFPIRMNRYEKFMTMVKELKMDNLLQTAEVPYKHHLLFEYYAMKQDTGKAKEQYGCIEPEDRNVEIDEMYISLMGPGTYETPKLQSNSDIVPEQNYNGNFKVALLTGRLSGVVSNLQNADYTEIDSWQSVTRPWKSKVRKIAHRIIGYHKIRKEINNSLELMKIIDSKIEKMNEN